MNARMMLLAAVLFGGCASTPETIVTERLPTPIGEVFLPVYPSEIPYSVRISVRALIAADGTVPSAQISPSSGNALWDSMAVVAIRSWHFSPATQNGRPVPAWIRFPITLRFADAQPIALAEIVVSDRSRADSIYALLLDGADFGALAVRYSEGTTAQDSGRLGARPLKEFALPVQMAITSIGAGQCARPVQIGGRFVIFKRLRKDVNS